MSLLNGSVVSDGEREDAERFFIRYYLDYPEEELPYRCPHCRLCVCDCVCLRSVCQSTLMADTAFSFSGTILS